MHPPLPLAGEGTGEGGTLGFEARHFGLFEIEIAYLEFGICDLGF